MTRLYLCGCWLEVKDCSLHKALLRSLADIYEHDVLLMEGAPVSIDCRRLAADFEEFLHDYGARHCRVEPVDPAEWRRPEETLLPTF
ncbi:hypothetical protein [Pyrodictium abyssi]|uniref:Uncharacterized protein n=1 Tax=Pyrodictium abyssi TaxID=54256 RepID=A0ABN6ZK81_9CREN|nr:hypothetical protein PABY_02160 [Pyrodictium abyssi]